MTPAVAPERLTYSVPEAAALLGVSERHLRTLIQRGEFRAVQLGTRWVVAKRYLTALLDERSTPA